MGLSSSLVPVVTLSLCKPGKEGARGQIKRVYWKPECSLWELYYISVFFSSRPMIPTPPNWAKKLILLFTVLITDVQFVTPSLTALPCVYTSAHSQDILIFITQEERCERDRVINIPAICRIIPEPSIWVIIVLLSLNHYDSWVKKYLRRLSPNPCSEFQPTWSSIDTAATKLTG